MFVIPDDLPIELTPFTFLIGSWQGTGIVSYPVGEQPTTETEFFQTISFRPMANGKLDFESVAQDQNGNLITSEKGFWMLSRPSNDGDSGPGLLLGTGVPAITVREDLELWRNAAGGFDMEAIIIQPSGIAELYFGQIKAARIDIATDAVMRSPNAKEYSAGQRVLGMVEGDLLWAWDMSAIGSPLKSHASARLERVVD